MNPNSESQILANDRPNYSRTPSGFTKTQNFIRQDPDAGELNPRQTLFKKKTMHRPTSSMNLLGDFVGRDSNFKNAAANGQSSCLNPGRHPLQTQQPNHNSSSSSSLDILSSKLHTDTFTNTLNT